MLFQISWLLIWVHPTKQVEFSDLQVHFPWNIFYNTKQSASSARKLPEYCCLHTICI